MADMDARYIGVFMLLSTQTGWASKVFDPTKPDFSVLTQVGLDGKFVSNFHDTFQQQKLLPAVKAMISGIEREPTINIMILRLFDTLAQIMATAVQTYSPPP